MSKFSENSKVRELLDDPDAKKVLEEYIPALAKSSQIEVVSGMALKKVLNFPQAQMTPEKKQEVYDALAALG